METLKARHRTRETGTRKAVVSCVLVEPLNIIICDMVVWSADAFLHFWSKRSFVFRQYVVNVSFTQGEFQVTMYSRKLRYASMSTLAVCFYEAIALGRTFAFETQWQKTATIACRFAWQNHLGET